MTKQDLLKVYAYTQAVLGSFKIPTEPLESQTTALVWLKFLKPYPLDIIYSAIDHYAKENNFINISRIAELCAKLSAINNGTYRDANYYLDEITKAISYANCRENFEKLSDFSKKIVKQPAYLAQYCNAGEAYEISIAPRLLKQIQEQLKIESMQKNIKDNAQLLSTQNQYNNKLLEENNV